MITKEDFLTKSVEDQKSLVSMNLADASWLAPETAATEDVAGADAKQGVKVRPIAPSPNRDAIENGATIQAIYLGMLPTKYPPVVPGKTGPADEFYEICTAQMQTEIDGVKQLKEVLVAKGEKFKRGSAYTAMKTINAKNYHGYMHVKTL